MLLARAMPHVSQQQFKSLRVAGTCGYLSLQISNSTPQAASYYHKAAVRSHLLLAKIIFMSMGSETWMH